MALSKTEFEELLTDFRKVAAEPNRFHVIPYRTRWIVSSMNPRYTRYFRSRDAAVEHARGLAEKSQGVLVMHRKDGDVEERFSFKESSAQAV
ncbi:MAG TPA: DUF2188 domain-containing protein [Thermoanaerobaculia bacterium]